MDMNRIWVYCNARWPTSFKFQMGETIYVIGDDRWEVSAFKLADMMRSKNSNITIEEWV